MKFRFSWEPWRPSKLLFDHWQVLTGLSCCRMDDFPGSYSKILLGSDRNFLVSTFLSGGSQSCLQVNSKPHVETISVHKAPMTYYPQSIHKVNFSRIYLLTVNVCMYVNVSMFVHAHRRKTFGSQCFPSIMSSGDQHRFSGLSRKQFFLLSHVSYPERVKQTNQNKTHTIKNISLAKNGFTLINLFNK